MKIAILTQPLGKNYGGIMQNWALQQVLKKMGHEVITIDRQPSQKKIALRSLRIIKLLLFKVTGRKLAPTLTTSQSIYVYSEMVSFINKNIVMSESITSTAQLKKHFNQNQYDLIIVGSDQVWRPKYSPNIYNFFLDFTHPSDKAITYAASFGVDDWEYNEEQTLICKKLAQRFNAVSVREKSAIDLCKEKLDISADLVLDPTLLISINEYKKLFKDIRPEHECKILTYILDSNKKKQALINKIAMHLDKKTFTAQPVKDIRDTVCIKDFKKIEDYKYHMVEEWISSFSNASFVITDSFHGCIFAIIFNKPFIAIGNAERGLSRFQSLLKTFNLMDRLILNNDKNLTKLLTQKIDWKTVNTLVIEYQKKSIAFLNKSI